MVETKLCIPSYFNSIVSILNKYFDVWQDEFSTNVYRRRYKNRILQYFSYLFDFKPLGWIEFNSYTGILDIYGDIDTFMEAANEIEQLGVKVIIHYKLKVKSSLD
jgi:hypothetical protein